MNGYVAPCALITIGTALFSFGVSLPSYNDPNWDQNIVVQPYVIADQLNANFDSLTVAWYAAKAKAETGRNDLMDLGAGLGACGLSMALLFAARRVRSWRDLLALQSPSSRVGFVALAALVWLSFIPAEWHWLGYTQRRGDYPWWADTLAIPMTQVLTFGLMGLPIIVVGAGVVVSRAVLPARLWTRPIMGRSFVVAPLVIVAAMAALAILLLAVVATPSIVPSAFLTLYLLLSARAAVATRGAVHA